MNTKLALTLPGLLLFALAACSDNDSDDLITYNGSTEETNADNNTDSTSRPAEIHFNLWDGTQGEYSISTGLDNGSGTSGYWYSFTDNNDGGSSTIKFPIEIGNEYSDDDMDAVIDACEGICGTITLENKTDGTSAFGGFAFNIAGVDDDYNPETADVSDWGGICVAYTSDEDISVEMSMDDKTNRSIDYDLPKVTLPKAEERNEKCFTWKMFKPSGAQTISGEAAAKKLTALRFTIYGESGTEVKFSIIALGTYNAPAQENPTSSSSAGPSSSSSELRFDMWNPEEYEDWVYTGLDNGTETSGYWYSFDDNYDGGTSRFSWPHEDWCCEDDSMLGIIEEFGGISGTAILGKGSLKTTPFVGIGFNVAGVADDYSAEAQPTDASSWGGICFAYDSELDFRVEMGPAGHPDDQSKQDLPGKFVQASLEETEVCIPWSDFKQKEGNEINGEQAAKQLASIRFTISGKDGTTGTINIKGIGTLNKVVVRDDYSSDQPSVIVTPVPREFDMWNGASGETRVYTGFNNGTSDAGYWNTITDNVIGGLSKLEWPSAYNGNYEPVLELCDGLCATAILAKGTMDSDPYVGLNFHIVGFIPGEAVEIMSTDVSEWGGLCIAYESELSLRIEMAPFGPYDDQDLLDLPGFTVPASAKDTTACIPWSNFKQNKSDQTTGEMAAKDLATLRFKFTGKDGTTGKFNIKGVGSYNNVVVRKDTISVIPLIPTTPTSYEFDMWNPVDGLYYVDTGLDHGYGNSGFWYDYNDKGDGGNTKIIYPEKLGNQYDDNAYDAVIAHCFGVCGTIEFSQDNPDLEAFAGIGFDVSGASSATDETPASADASEWGGICFAYESSMDFYVELGLDSDKEQELAYDVPNVLVKASEKDTLKCAAWSEFKQSRSSTLSGEDAAKQLVSIRFRFTGKSGTEGTFNIKGFGSYNAMK